MRNRVSSPSFETKWTRSARLTLAAAILFVALNAAHIIYRLTIPSLGWAGPDPEELDVATPYFELDFNAVGAFSNLAPGDIVQAVEGISAQQVLDDILNAPRPSNWQIGESVELIIQRNDQTSLLDVPLVHWTLSAWLLTNFGKYERILDWLLTLLVFGVGAFTFIKRPGNLSARFLFAFGLANLSITLGNSIPDYIALYFDLPAGLAKLVFSNVIFAYLLAPSFLGFALTFPKPKSLIQRQSRLLLLPYLIGSVTIILLFINPKLATIGFLLTFAMLVLGLVALIHSGLTMRDSISRAQMRWAVGGVAAGVALFMLNFASFAPPPYREIIFFAASLGWPIVGFSLAIAILRYRLFDIDFFIRKTLQYALLTGLLALVYFGSVILLQYLVENLTGEETPVVIVFSTLIIAGLFNPLRIRIQDFIDRRFYRAKFNAEKTLARFAATTRDQVDLESLSDAILSVVDETVRPDRISLWLRESKIRKK